MKRHSKPNDAHPRLVKITIWICDHWATLTLHLGTVLLACGGVLLSSWEQPGDDEKKTIFSIDVPAWTLDLAPIVFFLGVVLYVAGAISTLVIKSRQKPLREELANIKETSKQLRARLEDAEQAAGQLSIKRSTDIFRMVSDYLGHMSVEHQAFTDSERLSLYFHNEDHFKLIGRHSLNTELTKIGRPKIPATEGCLGHAWGDGGSQIYNLPTDDKDWLNELKNVYGINNQDARALRMKSRSICCIDLTEGYQRIGMMVFESTRNGFLKIEDIRQLVKIHTEFLLQALRSANGDEKIRDADQPGGWYE